jgi:exodeoxyribonuclease VII large subunit
MDFPDSIFTVTRLTEAIKDLLEGEFPFLWVEGEISNFRVPPSGHYYFTLKDRESQIRAVFFKSGQWGLSFKPENGLQVLCFGRLGVYAARGEYQIIIERMELKGWGTQQLAFEQLKDRLLKEGLFDGELKKPLPLLPRRVAIVTSPTGAVIQDFLRVLYRRYRNIHVFLYPVSVQGESASFEIAEALQALNQSDLGLEVIVLARGGGSLEDLWPFNEERVARAIAASPLPVISAIGHEVDFTIADFVADLRASTPSAAAELLIQPQKDWETRLRELQSRLIQPLQRKMGFYEEKLFHFQRRLKDPRRRLADLILRLDDQTARLRTALIRVLEKKQEALLRNSEKLWLRNPKTKVSTLRHNLDLLQLNVTTLMARRLEQTQKDLQAQHKTLLALSPWAVLDRGYALVRTLPGLKMVKEVDDTGSGQRVRVSLSGGELDCLVEETRTQKGLDGAGT